MHHRSANKLRAVLSAAILAATFLVAAPAQAASQTYTVTKTADTADGTCDADCSLREAITAANANAGHDTIVLPAGTYLLTIADADDDANANGDLDITDDVTILGDGAGTTTIDAGGDLDGAADGDFRIIEVTNDAALGIVDLTLTGGDAGDGDGVDGGAIYLAESAVLSLNSVTVEDNYASSNGGGVDAQDEGQIIRIEDSVFQRNGAGSDGGALTLEEGSLTLRDSRFEMNTAGSDGGALFLYTETNTGVWDTDFVDNEAGSNGGAVVIGDSSYGSQLQCRSCTLTGNTAGSDGGGFYLGSNENLLELWDTTIAENTSEDEGGGIWLDESALSMEGGVIRDNVAYLDGGGIAGEEIFVVLRNVDVLNNSAADPGDPTRQTTGGGISNEEDYGDIVLENVRVEGNTATHAGAGLYLYETSVVIRDSEFIDNSVIGGGAFDVEGGAISETNESRILIERSRFEGNSVTGQQNAHGGAIWREEGPTTVIDSSFVNNTAHTTHTADDTYTARGGVFFTDYSTPTLFEVRRSLFSGNAATGDAGATGQGGAIFLEDDTTAVVTNSTFSGNDAATAGGVFYGMDSGRLRLVSSTLAGNTAPDGAAIHLAADTGSGPGQANVKGSLAQGHGDDTCAGEAIVSDGWNIVDDTTCGLDESSDQDDTTAAYLPLADNGGPTMTHALPVTSAAIDAGADECTDLAGAFPLTTDQRGANRPVDGDLDDDAACDVGAFEYQEAVTVVASDADAHEAPGEGDDGTGTFTFTRPNSDGPLTVNYTVGGTATSGDDYAPLSGTATFADGELTTTATVDPVADELAEDDETVVVTIQPGLNYVVGTPSSATVTIVDGVGTTGVFRHGGEDRIATAVKVSQSLFVSHDHEATAFHAGEGHLEAGAVVLARSDDYPDALGGTPLAKANTAPLLLTRSPAANAAAGEPEVIDPVTLVEIDRVLPDGGTIYILGESAAISNEVEAQLAERWDIVRLGGPTRYETAVEIADAVSATPATIMVTTGENFPDALTAGVAAAETGGVVVLSRGTATHAATTAYIGANPGATVYGVGGPSAAAYPSSTGVVGQNRFETATLVAETFFDDPAVVGVARSDLFPDSLGGGAHVALLGGPLVLSDPASLTAGLGTTGNDFTEPYLEENAAAIARAHLYGGPVALSATVESDVADAIG